MLDRLLEEFGVYKMENYQLNRAVLEKNVAMKVMSVIFVNMEIKIAAIET